MKEEIGGVKARLEELKSPKAIPLHFFKEDSIEAFRRTIKEMFIGEENRAMTKR